jgi:Na+-translocating ferredoxin:NAD+ oxidoreductase RnfA subunit
MSVRTVVTLALTALFLENFVFTRFLGVRAVIDASRSLRLVFANGAVMTVLVVSPRRSCGFWTSICSCRGDLSICGFW